MLHPTQIAAIQRTWNLATIDADRAAARFYARLFDHDPELESLFAGADMVAQRRKFTGALSLIVKSLDRFVLIVPTLQSLGRDHLGHGVEPAHYDLVGRALVGALADTLGEEFAAEDREAWIRAYAVVAEVMQTAARRASDPTAGVLLESSGGFESGVARGV